MSKIDYRGKVRLFYDEVNVELVLFHFVDTWIKSEGNNILVCIVSCSQDLLLNIYIYCILL